MGKPTSGVRKPPGYTYPLVNRQTHVETLPSRNFVAGSNKSGIKRIQSGNLTCGKQTS